jgi:hypothetical protein
MMVENRESPTDARLLTRIRHIAWPVIVDEKSATTAAHVASKVVFAWSFLLVAVGLLDLLVVIVTPATHKPPGTSAASAFVWYTIGEGILFALIASRIRRVSLGWAIAGIVICVVGALAVLPSPFGFVVYAFLVLIFTNAVRASSKYKRVAVHLQ